MIRDIRVASRWMMRMLSFACSGSVMRPPSSISEKPMMEVIGVRSSWEALEKKSCRCFKAFRSEVTSKRTIMTPPFRR